jgi:hypothetical protein
MLSFDYIENSAEFFVELGINLEPLSNSSCYISNIVDFILFGASKLKVLQLFSSFFFKLFHADKGKRSKTKKRGHEISYPLLAFVTFSYLPIYMYNADLLPPVVAMHACIVLGLWDYAIPTACDVESRSMLVITDEKLSFVACIWCFWKAT